MVIKHREREEEFTYTRTKLDMLANKLSGSALILLLFNRLQNKNQEGRTIRQSFNRCKKFLCKFPFWHSIDEEKIYCTF